MMTVDDGNAETSILIRQKKVPVQQHLKSLTTAISSSPNQIMTVKEELNSRRQGSKKFTVYLNGDPQSSNTVTLEMEQLTDWNDFMLELDSGITFSAPTNEVFSVTGEQLRSIAEVLDHDSIVVGSGQPFIPLEYKNLQSSPGGLIGGVDSLVPKSVQLRKTLLVNGQKFVRSGLTKSVYAIDESVQSSFLPNNDLNSLLKTMSEEQVCYRDVSPSSTHIHYQLPNSVVRQNLHSKPRPLSCYGAPHSAYSNDNVSALKRIPYSLNSKIPKRIISSPTEQQQQSPSPTVTSSVESTSSHIKIASKGNFPITKSEKNGNLRTPSTSKEKPTKQEVIAKQRDFIRPRIVSVIRIGPKPRKVTRCLLNQKTARSFEQVLSDMTERIEAPWGAIRKMFTISGKPVEMLEDFFKDEKIFLACPNDRHLPDDFVLDIEEMKGIPNYSKLYPDLAKPKSSNIARIPQKRGKSLGENTNQRIPPVSYPTHPKYLSVSQLPNFILNKYFVGDIIGDGNFAVVRQCIDRISGVQYALKVIDKTKSGLDAPADHEVKILKSVNHPNIIHVFDDYDIKNELYVIMEHVTGGDLFDAIAQSVKFSEAESASFTKDIVSALSFLHRRGIIHRDIKPENLLVYLEGDKKRRIKVGDFGLAHYIDDDGPLYTVCGTPTYVAPEILAETGYGYKVDVWAMGIILYILLCGYPPFASSSGEQAELFDLILVGDYEFPAEQWDEISHDAKDLIMKMIESDTDVRVTADEVLDHPWLCDNVEEAEAKRHDFFKKDFRFNVFEQMGLTKLGLQIGSPNPSSNN